jgi:hypothetical protein
MVLRNVARFREAYIKLILCQMFYKQISLEDIISAA